MKKIIILSYLFFLLFVTLFSYLFVDPNLHYMQNIFLTARLVNRWVRIIGYALILVVFFLFYLYFLRLKLKDKLTNRECLTLIFSSVGILIFSYPAMFSYDIFNYIATAKVLFHYHENPYIVMPIEFTQDPLLSFMHAANKTALYGPLWVALTGIPFLLGLGNFVLTLFLFKLLVAICLLALLWVIYRLSKSYYAVLFFALNPLVLIETIVSGHNDVVMMLLLLFSFLLLVKKNILFSLIAYIGSVFIKFSTLTLFPIAMLFSYKIYRKKNLVDQKLYHYALIGMVVIFLLSFLRVEIYPWYAIWFLPFVALLNKRKEIKIIAVVLSFCLMLRYLPYMIFITHFGPTPLTKTLLTFAPPFLVTLWMVCRGKLWKKKSV